MILPGKSNKAISTLAAPITNVAGSLTLSVGTGIKFPQLLQFAMTVWSAAYTSPDEDPNAEIIYGTITVGDTVASLLRGQEETTGHAWALGDHVACTITAQTFADYSVLNFSSFTMPKILVTSDTAAVFTSANNPFTNSGSLAHTLGTGSVGINGLDQGVLVASSLLQLFEVSGTSGQGILASYLNGLGSGATITYTAAGGVVTVVTAAALVGGYNYYVGQYAKITGGDGTALAQVATLVGGGLGPGAVATWNTSPFYAGAASYTSQVGAATSTSPLLPVGYASQSVRVGFLSLNSSKKLLGMQWNGHDFKYVVGGPNLTTLPLMASGISGSILVPTWVDVPVGAFVSPTTSEIIITLTDSVGSNLAMAAPNDSYGAYNDATNPPLVSSYDLSVAQGIIGLEGSSIKWAAAGAGNHMNCYGGKDNL